MANPANYKRVMATLENGQTIYVYNMDMEAQLEPIVVSGLPEPVESSVGTMQYRLTNPSSGWFCSINADDEARLANLMQAEDSSILASVKPIKTYTAKDLAKAKPFKGGK